MISFELATARARHWRLSPPELASVCLYIGLVFAFVFIAVLALTRLFDLYRDGETSKQLLVQVRERVADSSRDSHSAKWPVGTPFVEGPTETVAIASLMQRLTQAVAAVGGNVVSSETDSRKAQNGYVRVIVTIELEEGALQPLIYDIEAGMPFLYVDQLMAQGSTPQVEKMRVVLGVSGLWKAVE
jgi:general secretion pathway protein M